MKTDAVDRQIIELLSGDARLSYRDIAKRLGASHARVSARIKKLEETGVIKGYSVVVDPDAEGLYSMCLRISAGLGNELSEVGRMIAELSQVHIVMRVSGECELLALTVSPDRQSALDLLAKINRIPGVGKTESHVVLESLKLSRFRLK